MHILLVDDEEEALGLLAGILQREGHAVDTCEDAESALVRLASATYDVMMTDQAMPGMSGTDLVLAARRLQSGLRCVVASGHTAPDESAQGDARWIGKPFDVDALLTLLGSA